MAASINDKHGNHLNIGYEVDIESDVGYTWEHDEQPSGYNYSTDSVKYSSHLYPEMSDVNVYLVSFNEDGQFHINNREMDCKQFQKQLEYGILKQLLNPELYSKLMHKSFERIVDKMEPPEPEYNGPDGDGY